MWRWAGAHDPDRIRCRLPAARLRQDRPEAADHQEHRHDVQLCRYPDADDPAHPGRARGCVRLGGRGAHDDHPVGRTDPRAISAVCAQPSRDRGRQRQPEGHPHARRPGEVRTCGRARRSVRSRRQIRAAGARESEGHCPPCEPRAAGDRSVEQGRARRGGRGHRLRQRHRDERPGGWRGHPRRPEPDRRLPDRGPEGNAEPHRGDRVRRSRTVDRGPDDPQSRRLRGGLRRAKTPAAIGILAALGLLLFLLPLAGLVIRAPWNQAFGELADPTTTTALGLSIFCSLTATGIALLLGIPLAMILASTRGTLRNVLRALTTLPMVLPPVVGGVALLLAFGRRGLVGSLLHQVFGIQIPFTTAAAVMAETFVAMPFLVIAVEAGLRSLDHRYEEAARSLGAGYWRVLTRVTLPLLRPAIFSGAVLCWARALGEFGATITFAGNFPGRTQTVPIAVYLALETKPEAAITLSLILLVVSAAILVGMRGRWLGGLWRSRLRRGPGAMPPCSNSRSPPPQVRRWPCSGPTAPVRQP